MKGPETIKIIGAKQHNLKDVTLEFPRGQLVVFTGVSGSGKSSLAFHTLFAEGQRRYVESLSAYARQFLDRMEKSDVERIEGLSPAIAIEQRNSAPNPRSTVATSTEVYDYLRVLYSAIGVPHDPDTGEALTRSTPDSIAGELLALPEGSKLMILAPLGSAPYKEQRHLLEKLRVQGFVRVRISGKLYELEDVPKRKPESKAALQLVVDRLVIRGGVSSRLIDSIETALKWTDSELEVLLDPGSEEEELRHYSTRFGNVETGFQLETITPKHFSFNSHLGACSHCHGLGSVLVADRELLVPDPSLSLDDGALVSWWKRNPKLKAVQDRSIAALVEHFSANTALPFSKLEQANEPFCQALFYGTGEEAIATGLKTKDKPFEGLVNQAQRLYETSKSESTKRNVRHFLRDQDCPKCQGKRLKRGVLSILLQGKGGESKSIDEFCALPVGEALEFLEERKWADREEEIGGEAARQIIARLRFLHNVGLGYLSLDRRSGSLSGGEAQRIRLATQIGGALSGVLYVLDEPSIGLHQQDNDRLLDTLRELRDLGNSVVVVEHDEDSIRAADYVVDIGPGAGESGGHIIFQGNQDEMLADEKSITGQYLNGTREIAIPKQRQSPVDINFTGSDDEDSVFDTPWVTIRGASENNLQGIDVAFPLGCFTCVTGMSGSGKSSLVDQILRRVLFKKFYRSKEKPGEHDHIEGIEKIDKVVLVDQTPLGRSPRSNPVTYAGAFSPIRDLFSKLPAAKVRGYSAGRFSFNVKGGRCETCKGDGAIQIDMHFLSDVYVPCEKCEGQRYNPETLEISYKGRNIAEVLQMTVDEAATFFASITPIYEKLAALQEVGLGYLRLGQPAPSLSGGEAQRVKLATELSKKSTGRTVYLLDEPTTGLHFADIETLLEVFYKLRDKGNSLIVIEHNLDVIKCADWVIDLGPGGGVEGGQLVAEGTPEQVAANEKSVTGRYLREKLNL